MRGRKPDKLDVEPPELVELKRVARDIEAPYRAVVAARILLARARGDRVLAVADYYHIDPSTVYRLTQAFRRLGTRLLLGHCQGKRLAGSRRVADPDGTLGVA